MNICIEEKVLALLVSGFDCAGDGGVDPFYQEQRDAVEQEVKPHRHRLNRLMSEMNQELDELHRPPQRGDTVQPTERALKFADGYCKFTRSSRLIVRMAMRPRRCSICKQHIESGQLYGAAKETSSGLCLGHVEQAA